MTWWDRSVAAFRWSARAFWMGSGALAGYSATGMHEEAGIVFTVALTAYATALVASLWGLFGLTRSVKEKKWEEKDK